MMGKLQRGQPFVVTTLKWCSLADLRIPTRRWGKYRAGHALEDLGVSGDVAAKLQDGKLADAKPVAEVKEQDVKQEKIRS